MPCDARGPSPSEEDRDQRQRMGCGREPGRRTPTSPSGGESGRLSFPVGAGSENTVRYAAGSGRRRRIRREVSRENATRVTRAGRRGGDRALIGLVAPLSAARRHLSPLCRRPCRARPRGGCPGREGRQGDSSGYGEGAATTGPPRPRARVVAVATGTAFPARMRPISTARDFAQQRTAALGLEPGQART